MADPVYDDDGIDLITLTFAVVLAAAIGPHTCAGSLKKPRHGSGAKLVLLRPWAGQGGKCPMQRMPGRCEKAPLRRG